MIATLLVAQIIGNTCPDWVPFWICAMVNQNTVGVVIAAGVVIGGVARLRHWREQE